MTCPFQLPYLYHKNNNIYLLHEDVETMNFLMCVMCFEDEKLPVKSKCCYFYYAYIYEGSQVHNSEEYIKAKIHYE